VAARTRVLVLKVNCGGQWLPVSITVSENMLSGLKSKDWAERARSYASLASQIKGKLRKQYRLDTAGLFLTEREIEIVGTRFRRSGAAKPPLPPQQAPASKKKTKKPKVHPGQLSLFGDAN
jgi:hypothetical protein